MYYGNRCNYLVVGSYVTILDKFTRSLNISLISHLVYKVSDMPKAPTNLQLRLNWELVREIITNLQWQKKFVSEI